MELRKLSSDTQKHLKEMFGSYSIPALIEVLGIVSQLLEGRGVKLEVFLNDEEFPQ